MSPLEHSLRDSCHRGFQYIPYPRGTRGVTTQIIKEKCSKNAILYNWRLEIGNKMVLWLFPAPHPGRDSLENDTKSLKTGPQFTKCWERILQWIESCVYRFFAKYEDVGRIIPHQLPVLNTSTNSLLQKKTECVMSYNKEQLDCCPLNQVQNCSIWWKWEAKQKTSKPDRNGDFQSLLNAFFLDMLSSHVCLHSFAF